MDITSKFKATVKTIKTRLKTQGDNAGGMGGLILSKKKETSEFTKQLKTVVASISQLRNFLVENRKDYLNASSPLHGESEGGMTDLERDEIDAVAGSTLKSCNDALNALRNIVGVENGQGREHRGVVMQLLSCYLKEVTNIYSEQRAIRVKRSIDRRRMARLDEMPRRAPGAVTSSQETPSRQVPDAAAIAREMGLEKSSYDVEEEFSPEEMQMFEEENEQLLEQVNSMMNEVKHVEGKVVEIARLQRVFSEKVLEQETVINRVQETTVASTENIIEGNEDIRNAMKKNASFRVWIIFCLVTISFTLLFLHWYND